MNELRQALEQQGIHLDRVDIDLRPSSPSGDSRSDYRDQSHQQTPTGGGNGSFGHAYGRQDNPLDVPQQTYMPAWSSERGTESEEPGLQEAENVEVVHLTPTGVDCVA